MQYIVESFGQLVCTGGLGLVARKPANTAVINYLVLFLWTQPLGESRVPLLDSWWRPKAGVSIFDRQNATPDGEPPLCYLQNIVHFLKSSGRRRIAGVTRKVREGTY